MKVFAFTKYHPEGPSSRLRFYQFEEALKKKGLQIEFCPLLPEGYVKALFEKRRFSKIIVFLSYLKRAFKLLTLPKGSVVWLEKEFFPFLPFVFERLFAFKAENVVVDYDDAIFHVYDQHRSSFVRKLLGRKIDLVMKNSRTVVAGNRYLADWASRAGAKKVFLVPTVVSKEQYDVQNRGSKLGQNVLGWIGSPVTQKFLDPLKDILLQKAESLNFKIHLIGASPNFWNHPRVEIIPWNEATEVQEIQKFTVGIMPLHDDLFEKGKCGYKLIQYMACGVPLIASPVGVNVEIVSPDVGYLAARTEDWSQAIEKIFASQEKTENMRRAALNRFESRYEASKAAQSISDILHEVGQQDEQEKRQQ